MGFDFNISEFVVIFKLDNMGSCIFVEMIKSYIGVLLVIVLDNKVLIVLVICLVIVVGVGEISGNFMFLEVKDLVLLLCVGVLLVLFDVMEECMVGLDLGFDVIEMGVIIGLIGVVLVFVFMIMFYWCWGLIVCISLVINIGFIIGLFSVFGVMFMLFGIVGIILIIGMVVDVNIFINEWIKEEFVKGKVVGFVILVGFDKVYVMIFDFSFIILIVVSLLFMFGSGLVKGFVIMIGIGIFIFIFMVVVVIC